MVRWRRRVIVLGLRECGGVDHDRTTGSPPRVPVPRLRFPRLLPFRRRPRSLLQQPLVLCCSVLVLFPFPSTLAPFHVRVSLFVHVPTSRRSTHPLTHAKKSSFFSQVTMCIYTKMVRTRLSLPVSFSLSSLFFFRFLLFVPFSFSSFSSFRLVSVSLSLSFCV